MARIADQDLTDHTLALIDRYIANDDALCFLARLVWQGAMSSCIAPLVRVAEDPEHDVYARIAATLAVSTCGLEEQRGDLWDVLLANDTDIHGEILAELVRSANETAKLNGVDPPAWLADVLERIPDYKINRIDELLPCNTAPAEDRKSHV